MAQMESYLTPAGYGEAELIEKRSRFIGRVWLTENEDEALARIKEMREKHWDATHNVYAYHIRATGAMRYSDDGEPSGTSGMPTLNVFRSEEIVNFCCVITRYFGGILLGAGGLVRAYSGTAKLALDAAGIQRMAQWTLFRLSCSYAQYERVRRVLDAHDCITENCDFGAAVVIDGLIRSDGFEALRGALTELTAGTVPVSETDTCFRGIRI